MLASTQCLSLHTVRDPKIPPRLALYSEDKVTITATKANPFAGESLSPDGVRAQLQTSLDAMKKESVEIFYLHAPDPDVPIETTLAEVQKLVCIPWSLHIAW
eukprot:SAG31_NODE_1086_length_9998_cov_2.389837_7_plen_102_part_00